MDPEKSILMDISSLGDPIIAGSNHISSTAGISADPLVFFALS